MSYFRRSKSNPRAGRIAIVVTPAMFFGADGFAPVFPSRQAFLDYGNSLRPSEDRDLGTFFNNSKLRIRSDGNLEVREDQGGKQYVYPRFARGNTNPGTKIVLGGELLRFLTDFFEDKFVIGFDMSELIEEAEKGE